MGASEAKLGAGSALYINEDVVSVPGDNELADWQGVGGDWALLFAEPKEVGLPGGEAGEVDVTHLLSPNRRREYIPGTVETGSFSGTANLRPAEYAAAMALVGKRIGMKVVTCATGTADDDEPDLDMAVYFLGHLSLGNPSLSFEGVREVPFTIKVDSDPVIDDSPSA